LCVYRGVNLIRLDAFGYTTKKRGTNCFFVEPEVWDVLDHVKATLADRNTEVLAEVHEHYTMQKRLAESGLWVYDFALPMLTLQACPLSAAPVCGERMLKELRCAFYILLNTLSQCCVKHYVVVICSALLALRCYNRSVEPVNLKAPIIRISTIPSTEDSVYQADAHVECMLNE
jgi:hypothetical protein